MKKLLILFFCGLTIFMYGQVEGVDYFMKYNCETNQYDVSIKVLDGFASKVPERVQLNSQISIVVPTGEAIVITNKYMPLQNNQNYNGTAPLDWTLSNPIFSPESQPENDFYSIFPKLSPASFYNDLAQGDMVPLFSFIAGTTGQYDEGVRFYKNGVDPDDNAPGMAGGDFSNGFTIGSTENIYNDNKVESCSVTAVKDAFLKSLNIYPNPFQNQVTVELFNDLSKVSVLGLDGKIYYQSDYESKGILRINTFHFPVGVYYIRIKTKNEMTVQKVVKF